MDITKLEEIAEGLKDWSLLTQLPKTIDGFSLLPGSGIDGQIINLAAYANEAMHCRLDITYTGETYDYVPVKTVGLHSFRDERFFCREQERFSEMMLAHVGDILRGIDRNFKHKFPYEAAELHFEQWDYWRSLPQTINGYELYITPDNPLPYINGSVIFLDYTDFANGHQLYFLYNIFRDEVFAEMKQHRLPLTTDAFTVPGGVPAEDKLAVLSKLLERNLFSTMESLKKA